MITAKSISKLEIGKVIHGDGLKVKKAKTGAAYYANIMVSGERIHRLLGKESEGFNLSRAKTALNKLRTDALDPEKQLELVGRASKQLRFDGAADLYIQTLTSTAGKNIRQKSQQLRDHLVPEFGKVMLSRVTTTMVEAYKAKRLEQGATKGTINSELAVINHMYSMLIEWGHIRTQPFKCKKFPTEQKKIEVLTKEQCTRLIDAAKGDIDPYTYMFILIGLSTGMRHKEILSLHGKHIDYQKLRFFIPSAKAGARYQPFHKSLVEPLRAHMAMLDDPNGWVFPAVSKTGHRDYMRKQFSRTVERAGLDPNRYTPHTMRHTLITRLIEAGHSAEQIQKISGHKSIQMVMHYTHIADSAVDSVLESVDLL